MKNLKKTIGLLTLTGVLFTSCMDEKKNNNSEEITDSEMNQNANVAQELKSKTSSTDKMLATNSNDLNSKSNTITTTSGAVVNRTLNTKVNAMQISGWDAFNTLSIEMKKLEGADFTTKSAAIPNLEATIATLHSTRPDWMKTEEITEDIEDVQKEYNEFIKEQNGKDKRNVRNLEELNEAYDDLVEEINETFDEYVTINRKANEEFREEMEDDGDIDDAREEYNEEIKKLNKVADDKK
ncbi:hypothetical protein JAO71_05705 [Olleya sp. YSTF-M6]|uniref:Lipoprotein n=1 Tax=Olleya sediminilitoris TaxID=2795739 RepID=A0ABS1WJL6_9FLAO|nr:hypothetical protein [Olleya sediminilitoris]MBL7559296.1 hypothetical protein [Olleya sediminilitoris]